MEIGSYSGSSAIMKGINGLNQASANINSGNSDLTTNIVEMKKNEILVKAGAKVVEAEKQNSDRLIDILA